MERPTRPKRKRSPVWQNLSCLFLVVMFVMTTTAAMAMVAPWFTAELGYFATERSITSPTLLHPLVSDTPVLLRQVILTSIARSKADISTGTDTPHILNQTPSLKSDQPTSSPDPSTPTASPTNSVTSTAHDTSTHTPTASHTSKPTATLTKTITLTATLTKTIPPPPTFTSTNAAQFTSTVTHIPPPVATNTPPPPPATDTPPPHATPTYTPNSPTSTQMPEDPTPTDTSSEPCNASGNSSYESTIVNLINQERTDQGLDPLTARGPLTAAARVHSTDMACNDVPFSHTGSDGSSSYDRITAQGYSCYWWGENIFASSSTSNPPQRAFDWWMNSTPHYNNMLNPNYQSIGVGYIYSPDSQYGGYFTVVFTRP